MTSTKFQELYGKLNKGQKEAVDAIEGPVMVIAGPGTGKTTVLTLRIANILQKTDTAPDSILALTFTDSGVAAMRKKLVGIIDAATYSVHIHTFHSFANEIIRLYPQEFSRIIGSQHMTDVDQLKIMEEIIKGTKLKKLKPVMNTYFYLKPILSHIKELKREDIDPYKFEEIVRMEEKNFEATADLYYESGKWNGEMKGKYKDIQKRIENNLELVVIYKKYQDALTEERLYDYEDMIMEVVRVLSLNKDLLLRLQEEYQYVLADEHQDANNAQNKLLELISGFHESPNLFIVGDEKQAIFRFQGASLENFLYFKNKYPDACLVTLLESYRSHQTLLDATHTLIGNSKNGHREKHERLVSPDRLSGSKIKIAEFGDISSEQDFIVGDIYRQISGGILPESIAVFYRNNKDAVGLVMALERARVSVTVHSDHDLLADEDIWKLLLLLRAINLPGDSERLAPILYIDFLKLNHLDAHRVIRESSRANISLGSFIRTKKFLVSAGVESVETFIVLAKSLNQWSIVAKNESLLKALETIVSESGFLAHIVSIPNSLEKLSLYDAFLNNVKNTAERHKNARLSDFLDYLDTLSEHEVEIKKETARGVPGSVNLMTAHKSKGLEFDIVYVAYAVDRVWGGGRRHSSFFSIPGVDGFNDDARIDDERRLFYVALTRARREVTITYSLKNETGKEDLPTRFIDEIGKDLVSLIDTTNLKKVKVLGTKIPSTTVLIKDQKYLSDLFLEQGLNVSALNNYLTCPWRYFFVNLIRIPKAEEKAQLYGTAVHETLKEFFDAYRKENDLGKKTLQELFEFHLSRKYLDSRDFKTLLLKGKEALSGYYDFYKNSWQKNIINEFRINGVFLPIYKNSKKTDLLLRGNLDKVEILSDGKVNVVDYKTGKPKTRNEILGTTKSSDGNYFRQLVFYKILLDNLEDGGYKMTSGEIDFIEPISKGKYRKEKFEVLAEHTEELKKEISRVALEIMSLSFFGKTCDDKDCEYCHLAKLINYN